MAIVETRYAVPGWGFGELWRRDGVVLAHDFHFERTVARCLTPGPAASATSAANGMTI